MEKETDRKTGLILEGGAMRGIFTCGVIDVLMEHGVSFDGAIGVSAGAAFGCNYKSRQIGRPIRYNLAFCRDRRYGSFWSLLTTGDLYGAKFCYHEIPERLDPFDSEAFQENPMEFYVVCTDVETGKPVYHRCTDGKGEDIEWFRASASMPLVSRVVSIGGRKLLDGGISDSIPLRYFEALGYNRNVVVLTQPLEYRKRKSSLTPAMRILMRKYPELNETFARRHARYNETVRRIRQRELAGELFVIRPPQSLGIGRMEKDPCELERVYHMGRETARRSLAGLSEFLS